MKVVSGKTDDFFTGVSRPVDEGLIDIDKGSGVDIGNGQRVGVEMENGRKFFFGFEELFLRFPSFGDISENADKKFFFIERHE